MTIIQIPAHPTNYSGNLGANQRRKIVLHWMVGEIGAADARFTKPNEKASAHYGIGSNGEVHQYVRDQDIAWHAGPGVNFEGIGIEHAGGQLLGDGSRKKPTPACHQTSAELVAMLAKKHNIPLDRNHVKKHNEYMATQCPGTLDVDWIINKAKEINSGVQIPLNYQLYAANGNVYDKFISGIHDGPYVIKDKVTGQVTDQGNIFLSSGTHDRVVGPNHSKRLYVMEFGGVIREIDLRDQTPPPVIDNLYKVIKNGNQVGAFDSKDNAFNAWYNDKSQKVMFNNQDVTQEFLNMANNLETKIKQLEEQLGSLNATIESLNSVVQKLKTDNEHLNMSNAAIKIENAALREENKKFMSSLFGILYSLFNRKNNG